jgi:hypothetical protein
MFGKIPRADVAAGALKARIQFRAAFAQMRNRALNLFFSLANVGVDLLLMSEVKSNRPIDLLQAERREILADGFRRVTSFER